MNHFIPIHASDLDAVLAECRRQTVQVEQLLGGLSAGAAVWRPDETRWSVAGHVSHLVILNTPYFPAMSAALAGARSKGRLSDGPYRHGWFGPWFAGSMEPPPKKRWKTAPNMVPDPDVGGGEVLARFRESQDALAAVVEDARGVDLGRARMSSPFMKLMRFSVGAGFGILLSHNRRHIWLVEELLAHEAFPG